MLAQGCPGPEMGVHKNELYCEQPTFVRLLPLECGLVIDFSVQVVPVLFIYLFSFFFFFFLS